MTTKEQVRRTLGLFGHEEQEATRIVIAGGGNIGLYVARTIEQRQSRTKVKIIESIARARGRRSPTSCAARWCCTAARSTRSCCMEADIHDADLMVALTNNDQVNILSSVMAKRLGCKSNLALINNPTYPRLHRARSASTPTSIPRSVTISRVLQHVRRGRIRAVHIVQRGAAEIIEAEALETSPLVGAAAARPRPAGRHAHRRDLPRRRGAQAERRAAGSSRRTASSSSRMAKAVKQVEQMFRVSLEFF